MEMRGVKRFEIAGHFNVPPTRITNVLRKPRIQKLRVRLCNKIDVHLFNHEGASKWQARPKSEQPTQSL